MGYFYIWNNEPVYCPPAHKEFKLNVVGAITKAILHVELESKWKLDKITFNDYQVKATGNVMDIDVTDYVKPNATNSVRLDYSGATMCFMGDRANAYVYLKTTELGYTAKGLTEEQVKQTIESLGWKTLIFLIVIAIILIALAYLLGKLDISGWSRELRGVIDEVRKHINL